MSLLRDFINKLRGTRPPPVIDSPWGPVSEQARLRAALNMQADPNLRKRVEELLADRLGSPEAARKEVRRRYPEAFTNPRKEE